MRETMSLVFFGVALCLAIPVLVVGCSNPKEAIPVVGTVTLDGKPVSWGAILFLPETDGAIASKASLRDGKFAFRAPGGLRRGEYLCVLDEDVVETDEPKPEEPDPTKTLPAHLPERYRQKSDLKITVSRSSTEFKLDLTSANEK